MSDDALKTSTLFRKPSFTKGIARSVDLFSQLDAYTTKQTDNETDLAAVKRDWKIVGENIFNAIKTYGSNRKGK